MKSETAVAGSELAGRAGALPEEPGAGETKAAVPSPSPSSASPPSPVHLPPPPPDSSPDWPSSPHLPSAASPGSAPSPESRPAPPESSLCPSCGEALVGEFCHGCGEKGAGSRDLSLRHFASDAAQEFTSVEHSKLFRTLYALLFRPGLLTSEWAAGRRRPYLKPLNLLFGVLALNFFALSLYRSPTTYSAAYLLANDDKGVLAKAMDKWATKRGLSGDAFVERVNEKWRGYAGLPPLQIFNAFLFALLLAAVHFFSKRYFVEHLVFSLHFLSFSLLSSTLLWPVYFVGGVDHKTRDLALSLLKVVLDAVYLFVALRVFYERAAFKNVLRSVVLLAGYFAIYFISYLVTLIAAFVAAAKY
jgi:hypothetical protein